MVFLNFVWVFTTRAYLRADVNITVFTHLSFGNIYHILQTHFPVLTLHTYCTCAYRFFKQWELHLHVCVQPVWSWPLLVFALWLLYIKYYYVLNLNFPLILVPTMLHSWWFVNVLCVLTISCQDATFISTDLPSQTNRTPGDGTRKQSELPAV